MNYLKLSWRNIWRNRRRTFITVLSIVVAVLLSSVMRALQEGQYNDMIQNTVGSFTGYVQVQESEYWQEKTLDNSFVATDTLLAVIKSDEAVKAAVPKLETFALAAGEQQSRPAMVMGIDIKKERFLSNPEERIHSGFYFTENDERAVLMGKDMLNRLDVQLGDSLVLIGQGFRGQSAAGLYEIKGTVGFPNSEMNNNTVMLPISTAQTFLGMENRLTALSLILHDAKKADNVVKQLKLELAEQDYNVMSWQEMMPELMQGIEADRGSGYILIFILYIVVGFGILGTVLMMINERSYEFGVMIAVGTPRISILKILAIEVLIMSLFGAGIGILAAIPIAWYFNINPIQITGENMTEVMTEYGLKPVIQLATEPSIFYSQAVIVFIITMVFCVIPLLKASRLNPVEAMRS